MIGPGARIARSAAYTHRDKLKENGALGNHFPILTIEIYRNCIIHREVSPPTLCVPEGPIRYQLPTSPSSHVR